MTTIKSVVLNSLVNDSMIAMDATHLIHKFGNIDTLSGSGEARVVDGKLVVKYTVFNNHGHFNSSENMEITVPVASIDSYKDMSYIQLQDTIEHDLAVAFLNFNSKSYFNDEVEDSLKREYITNKKIVEQMHKSLELFGCDMIATGRNLAYNNVNPDADWFGASITALKNTAKQF